MSWRLLSGFSVEGPSQAKIECDDKGDGSCDVRYWPQEAGEYAVHVLCNSEDIRLSPFMADIRDAPQDFHPDRVKSMCHWVGGHTGAGTLCPENWVASHQVKARGPGLEKTGVAVNKPAEFTVDAKHGGKAPLKVQVQVRCSPVPGVGWAGAHTWALTRRPLAPAHFAGQ